MFKKYSKKVIIFSLFILSLFVFTSEVLAAEVASYGFSKNDGGMTISVESESKMEGNVYLRTYREAKTRYYRGTFRFVLYKKGLFGYSEYDRQYKSTYNDCGVNTSWSNMSKAYYKGTLQLYESDGTDTILQTTFYID